MGRKSAEQIAAEKAKNEAKADGVAVVGEMQKETPLPPNTGETIKPAVFKQAGDNHKAITKHLRRGEVLVGVLDSNGTEILGQDFVTTEITAAKHYNNEAKFFIKKKA